MVHIVVPSSNSSKSIYTLSERNFLYSSPIASFSWLEKLSFFISLSTIILSCVHYFFSFYQDTHDSLNFALAIFIINACMLLVAALCLYYVYMNNKWEMTQNGSGLQLKMAEVIEMTKASHTAPQVHVMQGGHKIEEFSMTKVSQSAMPVVMVMGDSNQPALKRNYSVEESLRAGVIEEGNEKEEEVSNVSVYPVFNNRMGSKLADIPEGHESEYSVSQNLRDNEQNSNA